MDLPNRGSVLSIPVEYQETMTVASPAPRSSAASTSAATVPCTADASRNCSIRCSASPRSGSARSLYQRTAFLHVDYRKIVPIEKELQVDAGVDRVDGRKIFVAGRLLDGDAVLAEASALFVKLNPGQP